MGRKPGYTPAPNTVGAQLKKLATEGEPEKLDKFALMCEAVKLPENYSRRDPEAVQMQIEKYFSTCAALQIPAGNMALYMAIGYDRRDIPRALSKNDRISDLIKNACMRISSYREFAALTGEINPVYSIFLSKNYDGLSDAQKLEIDTTSNQDKTAADLIKTAGDLPE